MAHKGLILSVRDNWNVMPGRYNLHNITNWNRANGRLTRITAKLRSVFSTHYPKWRAWKKHNKILSVLFLLFVCRFLFFGRVWQRRYEPTMVMMPPFDDIDLGPRLRSKAPSVGPKPEPMKEISIADDLSYKKYNVMLLKIEKCSSTSLQTMLLRFADSHFLSVALPEIMVFQGDIVSEIPEEARTPNNKYNMLVYHTQLDKDVMSKALYDNTLYVTMLRDPIDRFVSHYLWFRQTDLNRPTMGEIGINEYILEYLKPRQNNTEFPRQMNYFLSYFGYFKNHDSLDIPDECFKEWEKTFDFVMITEYFQESLVFLMNLLNWDYDDVVTFDMNKRIKQEGDSDLTPEARKLLEKWTEGDRRLYKFFKLKFEQRMFEYGKEKLASEVGTLKERISFWESLCIARRGSNRDIGGLTRHRHTWRNDSVVYEISEQGKQYHFCIASLTTESYYRKLLINKQTKLVEHAYKFPT